MLALAALRSLGQLLLWDAARLPARASAVASARALGYQARGSAVRITICREVPHSWPHSGSPSGDPDRGAGPHKGKPNKHNTIKSSPRCGTNIYPLWINGWRSARLWPLCAVGDAPAKRARQKSALDSASIRFQRHSTTSLRTQVRRDYMVSATV